MIGIGISPVHSGIPGAGSGRAGAYWLWYESFATAAAAPLSSGAANPGPGTTNYTGTTASKSGGSYVEDCSTASGPFQNTGYARSRGLAVVVRGLNYSRLTSAIDIGFTTAAGMGQSSGRPLLSASASLVQTDGTTAQTAYATTPLSTGVEYDFCVIADPALGGWTFWKTSAAANWTMAGLTRFDTTATLFARLKAANDAFTCKSIGLAAGVPIPQRYNVSGSTFTLPVANNFILSLPVTTGTGTNGVRFRVQDPSNHFRAERTAAGALRIVRVDVGVDTVVQTSAMTAAAGDRLYLRVEANSARISGHPTGGTWVNPTLATITQYAASLGIEVMDPANAGTLEIFPLTQSLILPSGA